MKQNTFMSFLVKQMINGRIKQWNKFKKSFWNLVFHFMLIFHYNCCIIDNNDVIEKEVLKKKRNEFDGILIQMKSGQNHLKY